MKKYLAISIFIALNLSLLGQQKLNLPSIFSDNMVLQQNSNVSFWGWGNPNTEIEIKTSWGSIVKGLIKSDSSWNLKFDTPSAGGPFLISIASEEELISLQNIMLGEVWLCSGQSNMEMPMMGWLPNDLIDNSDYEIENSNYPDIRLFTVEKTVSVNVQNDLKGDWKECSPQTVPNFSATAYFFGKKLYQELKIPIGLIHSSWGGTPAEAWTDVKYLADVPGYQDFANKLEEMIPKQKEFQAWLANHKTIHIDDVNSTTEFVEMELSDLDCSTIEFDDTKWENMMLPIVWEASDVGNFDGIIWFRKEIDITENMLNNDLVLELGPIDDMDLTFFNGVKIGGYEAGGFWNTPRKYVIPKELVIKKHNVIAVRVIDTQGGGGIFGDIDDLKVYSKETPNEFISLAGNWKYLPIAEYLNNNFYVYEIEKNEFAQRPGFAINVNSQSPTMLYNGMIAPIAGYNIRGAIWYQGESNVGRAEQYKKLFPAMITSWRNAWGQVDFPFYFVQIAPYNYSDSNNSESAKLREAQLSALSLKNTGMVVTLDIGNPRNIHPSNKLDVGQRLALWALTKDYGKTDLVYSGPIYKSMKIINNKIEIEFDQIGSGLVLKNNKSEGQFLISGTDGNFKPANVELVDNKLVLESESITSPTSVRYAFTNAAEAVLFNVEGLPASSFRTDNW